MSVSVDFDHEFPYRDLKHLFVPAVNVSLIGPTGEEDLIAIWDTGAHYCLFNGLRAVSIGLDLTSGRPEILGGLAGSLQARIHKVYLEIFGKRFQCEVAFSEHPISRELLGRHTLFNQIRVGFREGISTGYFHPTR
jgi:hypothetical protein